MKTLDVVGLLIKFKGLEDVLCWDGVFKPRFCIAGGSAEWNGLKCNAFEMKGKGAEGRNMTCWLLSPGSHRYILSGKCTCVYIVCV